MAFSDTDPFAVGDATTVTKLNQGVENTRRMIDGSKAFDVLVVGGPERNTGIISPPTITGNQDNYTPTGLSTARILRLIADAARSISGIAAQADGTRLTLANITGTSANTITLLHQTTSTVENRFICPGAVNFVLNEGDCVEIWYDGATDRWRVMAF